MIAGCFPTEGAPNLPKGITSSELVEHLQDCHYWDYLNTDLLEGIIRHVSGEESHLASLMAEYKESFRSKVTHTLEECKRKNLKPEPPPHYTTIAVEVNNGRSHLRKFPPPSDPAAACVKCCKQTVLRVMAVS